MGLPRVSRFRPGKSRFTVTDPGGSAIIFIERGDRDRQAREAWADPALTPPERQLALAERLLTFKDDPEAARQILERLASDPGLRPSIRMEIERLLRELGS